MYNLAAKKIGGLEEEVAFATFGHKLDFKWGLHVINLWFSEARRKQEGKLQMS